MRKEIGSEFWDIPISKKCNDIFPNDTLWFLSGRTALKYIIQDAKIKSVLMPSWCCDSMIQPFIECGVDVFFDSSNKSIYDCDAFFIMDYFGFTDQNFVPQDYQGIVIRDVTHSVFSKEYSDADYYFGSLRKWAGFKTGGFAFGKWKNSNSILECDLNYVNLRSDAMHLKEKYINSEINLKQFLDVFEKANIYLKNTEICGALESDIDAAKHLDIEFIKNKRRENAKVLISRIGCLFSLKETDCPLFVPIKTKYRNELRKYLIDHNVYCPVHWPRMNLNNSELSLVCDQRYSVEDMNYICDLIEEFYNGRR